MRKVFRGALVVAISGAMLGGFSACKDTQDDLLYETQLEFTQKLKDQNTALDELRESQAAALAEAINNLKKEINSCNCNPQDLVDLRNAISALESKLDDKTGTLGSQITNINTEVTNLQQALADLTNSLANYATKDDLNNYATKDDLNNYASKADLQDAVDTLNKLNQDFTALQAGLSQQIQDAINDALTNYATVAQLEDSIQSVRDEAKENLDNAVAILNEENQKVAKKLDDLIEEYNKTANKLDTFLGDYTGTLGDLISAYEAADKELQDQIDALSTRVEANEKAIEAVKKQLAKLVTSVIVQGTYNPLIGSFTLPANVQSNVLCAFYGETDNDIEFPSTLTGNLVDQAARLSAGDIKLLEETGLDSKLQIINGTKLLGGEGNAGKIYVTVNPTAVDFEGLSFDLVNSLDEKAGITLSSLTPSKDKLTFGYSRGEAANGFYEAKATLKEADINKAKLSFNKSALVAAVKDLYQNKTAAKLTTVVGALYDAVNDNLDRNAVKASWTNEGTANSVYSQYGVAAFAIKPLSYAFDPSVSYTIPNISLNIPSLDDFKFEFNLGELNLDFNFDLSFDLNFDLNDFEITIGEIELGSIDLSGVNPTVEVKFEYDYPVFEEKTIAGETILVVAKDENDKDKTEVHEGTATVSLDNFMSDLSKEMSSAINEQINTAIQSMTADLSSSIKKQIKEQILDQLSTKLNEQIAGQINEKINNMATDLNSQVNDLMSDLAGQINDKIGSTLDSAQSYLDKLQNLIDRLNSYINRINNLSVGDKIHAYLQPTLVYQTNSSYFSQVSTSANNPTVFKVAGGNAIILHPTSYSAELVAPAFKKFVGVTNVYSNDNATVTAQKGDSKCLAAARTANSQKYINEVFDGGRYGVPFVGQAGYTYEIVYAALDYQGKVALRKYYIKVI
jgi:hypothetical protein